MLPEIAWCGNTGTRSRAVLLRRGHLDVRGVACRRVAVLGLSDGGGTSSRRGSQLTRPVFGAGRSVGIPPSSLAVRVVPTPRVTRTGASPARCAIGASETPARNQPHVLLGRRPRRRAHGDGTAKLRRVPLPPALMNQPRGLPANSCSTESGFVPGTPPDGRTDARLEPSSSRAEPTCRRVRPGAGPDHRCARSRSGPRLRRELARPVRAAAPASRPAAPR